MQNNNISLTGIGAKVASNEEMRLNVVRECVRCTLIKYSLSDDLSFMMKSESRGHAYALDWKRHGKGVDTKCF